MFVVTNCSVKCCNHKRVGLYYLLFTLLFGLSGLILSITIRFELCSSGNRLVTLENKNLYNLNITLHGLLMIFFLVMPSLFGGHGNIFIPIYLGTSEVTYPRINSLSILIIPLSYLILFLCLYSEFSLGTGWTLYPPLSTSLMSSSPIGIDVIIYGLICIGISSSLTSINFSITILCMKLYGHLISNLSIYIWSIGITTLLLIFVLPILTCALIL